MFDAIFLDRDGTIIKDSGYIKNIKKVKFYSFTFEALRLAQKYFKLFIITNQTGVSKGLMSIEDVVRVNDYILDILKQNDIFIQNIYFVHIQKRRIAIVENHLHILLKLQLKNMV